MPREIIETERHRASREAQAGFKVKASEKPSQAALREAQRRWGKNAAVKQYRHPSSADGRADASARSVAARERVKAIDAEIAARLAELDWYQALITEKREQQKMRDEAMGEACYHQFIVGRVEMGFFSVRGSGDSWDEAFYKADNK